MKQFLEGIRILEWAVLHSAPYAASQLRELGAEVVKLEEKNSGDMARWFETMGGGIPIMPVPGHSYLFETANRGKKSVALDIKKARGKEVVRRLVEKSDVFLTNYRSQAAVSLDLGYDTLSAINPRLIYVDVSGYGEKGAYAGSPAIDLAVAARSGIMMAEREPEEEPFLPMGITDQMASMAAMFGIIGGLLARERLGIGQKVSASLLGSMVWLQTINVSTALSAGEEFRPQHRISAFNPLLNLYKAGDGKWIYLGMGAQVQKYWPSFCRALGLSHLEKDPRFETMDKRTENREELVRILDGVFLKHTRAEWLDLLKNYDLVVSPVNTVSEMTKDPQVLENNYLVECKDLGWAVPRAPGQPVHFGSTPARVYANAPDLGQHTEEVLMNVAGYTQQEVDKLREEAVI